MDLTQFAAGYGFKIPLACTSAVWHAIAWNDSIEERKPDATGQSTDARLHDVLSMAAMAARAAAKTEESVVQFPVLMVPADGSATTPCQVVLRLVVGGGDGGEPVLTLMFPNED